MHANSAEEMMRLVCAHIPQPFSLFQAAFRMGDMFPTEPRGTFMDGWHQLQSQGELKQTGPTEWLYSGPSYSRERSQTPGCS